MEVLGLGWLFTEDVGDGRGRLVAHPERPGLLRRSEDFYFALSDGDSLRAAAREDVAHLHSVQAAQDQRFAGPA